MKINTQNSTLLISAGRSDQFPARDIPHIVFSGRSNVGKSSLINVLLGRKALARVSSAPGKTITVNFYSIDGKLFFVDLPGYGYAKRAGADRERFSRLTDEYLRTENAGKRLVIQLVDMKAGPTDDDYMMLDWLERTSTPYIIVSTKADKLNRTDRNAAETELKKLGATLIPFSALTGEGKDMIWNEISKLTER